MEQFEPITGHDRYEINRSGVIRNCKTKKIKSQYLNDIGYPMVSFSYSGRTKPYRVHRLIAETFIPNPKGLKYVNHKDGNKKNYSIENLEWCTHLENMRHAFTNGLVNNTGEKNGMAKLNESKVREIKKLLSDGLSQQKIANIIGGISRSAILKIKLGKDWNHVQI